MKDYLIVNDKNIIENIITIDSLDMVEYFGAKEKYENAKIGDVYFPPILKIEKINNSKEKLSTFLSNNPILWKDGKYYSVTQEKQSLLTSNIATYQIEIQTNPSAVITWNSTGEECVEWNINDLCALAVAIKDYVKPMVTYQQKKEIEINQAKTIEELNQIEIDYSSVKVQPVWNEE